MGGHLLDFLLIGTGWRGGQHLFVHLSGRIDSVETECGRFLAGRGGLVAQLILEKRRGTLLLLLLTRVLLRSRRTLLIALLSQSGARKRKYPGKTAFHNC